MKKKIKWYVRLLSIFGIVIGSIVALCGIIVLQGTCFLTYKGPNSTSKNWMSNLNDETLLCETKLPGSHDACTYDMLWLGECQQFNIKQQLECGVRYFDIRVKNNDGKYQIYHGPINGVSFDPIVDSIQSFLINNPTETLILDFQHFENGAQDYVYQKVNEKLLSYAVKNETMKSDLEFISNLKIKDVRGKCVIFFGYGAYSDSNYIFKRNNDDCTMSDCSLDSCYFTERNTSDSKTYINEHIPFYISKIQEKETRDGFKGLTVLQGQLTDGLLVFGPYSKERSHEKNMSNYVKSLKTKDYFSSLNIIMRDFMDAKKSSEIYNLNF